MKTPPSKHILLAGFSGAGKSTALAELRRLLPVIPCLDLDALVSDDVASFIQHQGWPAFRKRETEMLDKTLQQNNPVVLALGGGALEQGWAVINQYPSAQVVHLDCPFEVCWGRIQTQPGLRPLAQQGEAKMRALFEERKVQYAHCRLKVDATQSPEDVALAILRHTGLA